MNKVYLINYAVEGIKNIEDWVEFSFYKKTITKSFSVKQFNIKGIYGINGAGKSAVIRSAEILKYLVLDPDYLSDPYVQNLLNDLVNKKKKTFGAKLDFIHCANKEMVMYRYEIKIEKNQLKSYVITSERLCFKNALSKSGNWNALYHTEYGKLYVDVKNAQSDKLIDETKNLLSKASLSALFRGSETLIRDKELDDNVWNGLASLLLLAINVQVYMDQGDDHRAFYINRNLKEDKLTDILSPDPSTTRINRLSGRSFTAFSPDRMYMKKDVYPVFEENTKRLCEFIKIFKNDLVNIGIKRKEEEDCYVCSLVMNYSDYSIDSEFESTGIKKLVKLFDYLDKMVNGGIVFIDELDSNLHDVYLCALLEYLAENAEGQICFTAHNIGPMDILRKNRKSIDFLSCDHKVISWTKSGNYSPASLYRNGMIEGSAFNVFPFDFVKAFYSAGKDK